MPAANQLAHIALEYSGSSRSAKFKELRCAYYYYNPAVLFPLK